MREYKTAYFVRRPRVYAELENPQSWGRLKAYEISGTVELGPVDYENFITDMLADRCFIEEHAAVCGQGESWRCLLVRRCGAHDGVLVMPERECYVGYAACWADDEVNGTAPDET